MQVEQLPGMEEEQVVRLQAAGIRNCRQLLRAGQRPERFLNLVRKTGLLPDTLRDFVGRAELYQIRGIGATTLARLFEIGVDSLDALAVYEPETLRAELQRTVVRPPNLAVVEDWIRQARNEKGGEASSPQTSLTA